MDDQQLLRYSRHILLPEIGINGQERICKARVLVIGAGGLGSPVAMYLAASGVGHITLCDHDKVDLTNLQRQILHSTSRAGFNKAESGALTLADINPHITLQPVPLRIADKELELEVTRHDVIVDCSDNFATRYALNKACRLHNVPLVSGAAIRFSGQVSVFDFRQPKAPCYNCLYPEDSETDEERCATMGVFAPLVGIIGSIQACETLKLLAQIPGTLHSRLLLLDAKVMEPRVIRLHQDPSCKVCSRLSA